MDDLAYGTRNKRGDWQPKEALEGSPLFRLPPRPLDVLKWLPGYFLPWNAFYFGLAALFWFWLTPGFDTLKTLDWRWILAIFARNALAVFLCYGALDLRLYIQRAQGTRFKYNGRFPQDQTNDAFIRGSQTLDGMIRTYATGVPVWTAYEVLALWLFANGYAPMASFAEHPVWLIAIGVLLPILHEAHFYAVHRLIHVPVLYRHIHSVHHNSVNPSPWSSLAMHPVEHILYFSGCLIHLVILSHPLLALYHLSVAGFGAVGGHIGFDRIETGRDNAVVTHSFDHYLHHKYFEVNYAGGNIPFDRWFGTWHDGTAEGDRLMKVRWARKKQATGG